MMAISRKSTSATGWLLLAGLLALLGGSARAAAQTGIQAHAPAAPVRPLTGRTISGVVLNAKTGQAIFDAEVTLTRTPTQNQGRVLTASTTTDAEGRFSLTNVPDGKYALHASHRGYIGSDYEEHGTVSTAIVTGADQNTTGLEFRLAPQAVLYGTVTEDSGDPVPQAQVAVYRQDPGGGTGRTVRMSMTGADEQGNYEIANLAPGNYFLSVSGTPWYATDPQENSAASRISAARSQLDVAYPTTFYPDATDAAFAAPIAVAAGDRVEVNLTLHPVPSLHIVVRIPTRQPAVPQLSQDLFGSVDSVPARMSFTTPDAKSADPTTTVELSGIAPGQYDLSLLGQSGEAGREASVNLTGDQAIDVASATVLAEVSGKLLPAGSGKLPASLFLFLSPQEPQSGQDRAFTRLETDGSFHFRSVRPGTYELVVSANEYPMTVTGLSASGAAVAGRLIRIGNEPVALTATVAESSALLHGFAKSGGKPVSGVFLLLVPTSPNAGREAWRSNQSDSDGSFDFPQVMPGEYTLVAIREGWALDWARPEAIAPYLAGGLRVTVPAHGGEIVLKDPVEVQPR